MSQLTPKNTQATPEQQQAIYTDHSTIGNLLVSASAGSGKTRVLVERVIHQLLRDEEPIALDQLVIVTFTELAAREMKERIERELKKAFNAETDAKRRRFIHSQLAKLSSANIQTIDAFCRQIVQRYYYIIDLDPNFTMLTDDTALMLFQERVFEDMVSAILPEDGALHADYYQDYECAMLNFSDGSPASADRVQTIIMALIDKARAHAHPKNWLDSLLDWYPKPDETYGTSALFLEVVRPKLATALEADVKPYRQLVSDYQVEAERLGGTLLKNIEKIRLTLADYERFLEELKTPTVPYDTLFDHANHLMKFPSIRAVKDPKTEEAALRQELSEVIGPLNKAFHQKYDAKTREMDQYLGFSDATQTELLADARAVAQAIVHLAQKFLEALAESMAKEQVMDFAAMELAALEILTTANADGIYEAKMYYQQTMAEILIDEYQDVNGLQEAIMQAISCEEVSDQADNRFMVGDLKQSIYRFRFSDPSLFQSKYEAYPVLKPDTPAGSDVRVTLKENFRSRPEVLNFVNVIFNRIMDRAVGGVDYRKEAQLIHGNQEYTPQDIYQPELLITDAVGADEASLADESAATREAWVVAKRIQTLIDDAFPIYDRALKTTRPLTYRDIAILGNTRGHYLELEKVFNQVGIPIEQDRRENFFNRTEIMTMVAILKLVDNPKQDIPLAAVLRSPLIAMSEPELAEIRAAHPKDRYEVAVKDYAVSGKNEQIKQKLNRLMTWLTQWRQKSKTATLSQLIWQIYQDTGYLDYVAGQQNGTQRQTNLFALIHQAEAFEKQMAQGLFEFVRYIEAIEDHQKDLATPQTLDPNSDAVQLISVHGSKGLEFPVVFYFNAQKKFNIQDTNARWLVSDHFGLGVKRTNYQDLYAYSTPLMALAIQDEREAMLAEEMRKLYVALTRSEQKLIIVADRAQFVERDMSGDDDLTESATTILNDSERLKITVTPLDWIIKALRPYRSHHLTWTNQQDNDELVKQKATLAFGKDAQTTGHLTIQVVFHPTHGMERYATHSSTKSIFQLPRKQATHIITSPLTFTYPNQAATITESNQSVSEWKRQLYAAEDQRIAPWRPEPDFQTRTRQRTYQAADFPKPAFLNAAETTRKSAMEQGSALHLLMQQISLLNRPTQAAFQTLAAQLEADGRLAKGLITPALCQHLADFFDPTLAIKRKLDMGQRLLSNASRLQRERPFTYQKPTSAISDRITPSHTNDPILIHGVIDGFFYDEQGAWWLFDYKTDRLDGLTFSRQRDLLLSRYQVQLALYREALEQVVKKEIAHTLIISLDTLESFEFNPDELRLDD
ncbi:MAG: helicase-exonuclease AddAB subunit AddA [Aerococcus sp.]|nr:helicase-exonuclease AddAB subunit AddA [Aerococcus sp.]